MGDLSLDDLKAFDTLLSGASNIAESIGTMNVAEDKAIQGKEPLDSEVLIDELKIENIKY